MSGLLTSFNGPGAPLTDWQSLRVFSEADARNNERPANFQLCRDSGLKHNGQRFLRVLGFWQVLSLVIGSVIGTGIFIFVAPVAANLMEPWLILSAFVIGSCVAFSGALCVSELSSTYPETGGFYVYLKRAYGPVTGFLYAWMRFFCIRVGSIGIAALAAAGFFCEVFEFSSEVAGDLKKPVAIAGVCIFTLINILGIRPGARVQVLFTIPKILCLIGLICMGLIFKGGFVDGNDLTVLDTSLTHGSNFEKPLILAFLLSMAPILWIYSGWDDPPFIAEEIRNPQVNLPRAILTGLGLTILLYLLVICSYLVVLSPLEIANTHSTAILSILKVYGPVPAHILAIFLLSSGLGLLNVSIMTGARVAWAASLDHLMFRWFRDLHPSAHTPQRALLTQGGLAIFLIYFIEDIGSLLSWTSISYWIFSGLAGASLIVLRKKNPDMLRSFKVPFYPLPSLIYSTISFLIVLILVYENTLYFLINLLIIGLGIVAYFTQEKLQPQSSSL